MSDGNTTNDVTTTNDVNGGAETAQPQTTPPPTSASLTLKWADGVPDDFRNSYTEASAKLGMSEAHAQGVADFLASRNAAMREAVTKYRAAEEASWKQALESHAEFGGAKLKATMAARDAAQKRYASEGLMKLLNESGYANHPEVVAHFARLGLANAESSTAGTQSRAAVNAKPSLKDVYPNSPVLKF